MSCVKISCVKKSGLVSITRQVSRIAGEWGRWCFPELHPRAQEAAEFITSPQSLRGLRDIFRHESINGFPAAYPVVVRCTFSNALLLSYQNDSHKIPQVK